MLNKHTTILFFAAVVCAIVMLAAASAQPSTMVKAQGATAVPTVAPTSPFTGLGTPTATSVAPGCDPVFPIELGTEMTLRPGVNIRYGPGVSTPWLTSFTENKIFTVIDGPVCADRYNWWLISGHGVTGWVAERDSTRTFIRFYVPEGATECRTPLVLPLGEKITLTTGVRIREVPGLSGLVLTVAPQDAVAEIIDAKSQCVDGFNWWKVRVTVVNIRYEGWMVEGTASDDPDVFAYLELTPAPDCSQPMLASVGDRGRVRYFDRTPKNLHSEPGREGEILYTLVEGVPLEIIGGPVCKDGLNWWQIRILANVQASGWFAEGARPNYWINITNDIGDIPITNTPVPTVFGAVTVTPAPTITLVPTITTTRTP